MPTPPCCVLTSSAACPFAADVDGTGTEVLAPCCPFEVDVVGCVGVASEGEFVCHLQIRISKNFKMFCYNYLVTLLSIVIVSFSITGHLL